MEMLNKYNDELFKTCLLNSMEKSWKMVKKSTGWYFHYDAKLKKKKNEHKIKMRKKREQLWNEVAVAMVMANANCKNETQVEWMKRHDKNEKRENERK